MLSEEEKKAMETMNTIIEFGGDNFLCKEHRKQLQTILNIIEKQQKEIEELKEINKKQFLNYEKTIDNMEHKALDYISKDKIRECIQTPYPEVAIENIVELLEEELLEEE